MADETETPLHSTQFQVLDQKQTSELVDGLLRSLAAIQAEKDPFALEQKLADHQRLLGRLEIRIRPQKQSG